MRLKVGVAGGLVRISLSVFWTSAALINESLKKARRLCSALLGHNVAQCMNWPEGADEEGLRERREQMRCLCALVFGVYCM